MSTISAGTTSTTALVNTGDTTGNLVFQTNGTTTAMTIDTSQRVGIGTSSPTYKLDVVDSAASAILGLRVKTTGAGGQALLDLDSTASGAAAYLRYLGAGVENARITADSTSINFNTGSGATERMRITSGGDVGIGTSSPANKLHVVSAGSTATEAVMRINNPYTSGTAVASASLLFTYHSGASERPAAKIDAGQLTAGSFANGYLDFYVETSDAIPATPQVRIDSSGNLLVGTTAPLNGSRFYTVATGSAIAGGFKNDAAGYQTIQVWNAAAAGTRNLIQFSAGTGGTSVGTVSTDGTNTTYGTSSDYRLKENIQPMTGALEKVAQLKPCTYTWKATGAPGQGFIAHELQAVVPDAVVGEKDAVNEDGSIKAQNIDTSFLVATLTAAIQELKTQNDDLRARVAALEGAA